MDNKLREIRKAKAFTLQGLAAAAKSTPATLIFVELYDHLPGPDLRNRIAEALGVGEAEIWLTLEAECGTDGRVHCEEARE